MSDKTIRSAPYTFTITHTDWGWKVSGKSDAKGDLSLLDWHEHEPRLTKRGGDALWDLVDEQLFESMAKAEKAVRNWLKAYGGVAR